MSDTSAAEQTDSGQRARELARTFDIWDPKLNDDPYPVLRELQQECPVAYSEALGGYWVVTSYDAVREVFTHPGVYSSQILQVPPPDDPPVLIPETLDPPTHTAYRQVMAPLFSPPAVAALQDSTRSLIHDLLVSFVAEGGGDFVREVAVPLPAKVFLSVLGLPWEDVEKLQSYRDALMRGIASPDEKVAEHARTVLMPEAMQYFAEAAASRRAMTDPPHDLLTAMVTGRLELDGGRTMTDDEVVNALILLVAAGLDTVTAVLAKAVMTLATRPDLRQQLLDDPTVIPSATEEFIRYWALVATCRRATSDTLLNEMPIKAGDVVNISTVAASRDPKEFERPDEIDLRRAPNRHLAFGAGPHRCIGSHLARMEVSVCLDELMRVMPHFELDPSDPPVQRFGQVIGVDRLALVVASPTPA
jgi:cytochrome P450